MDSAGILIRQDSALRFPRCGILRVYCPEPETVPDLFLNILEIAAVLEPAGIIAGRPSEEPGIIRKIVCFVHNVGPLSVQPVRMHERFYGFSFRPREGDAEGVHQKRRVVAGFSVPGHGPVVELYIHTPGSQFPGERIDEHLIAQPAPQLNDGFLFSQCRAVQVSAYFACRDRCLFHHPERCVLHVLAQPVRSGTAEAAAHPVVDRIRLFLRVQFSLFRRYNDRLPVLLLLFCTKQPVFLLFFRCTPQILHDAQMLQQTDPLPDSALFFLPQRQIFQCRPDVLSSAVKAVGTAEGGAAGYDGICPEPAVIEHFIYVFCPAGFQQRKASIDLIFMDYTRTEPQFLFQETAPADHGKPDRGRKAPVFHLSAEQLCTGIYPVCAQIPLEIELVLFLGKCLCLLVVAIADTVQTQDVQFPFYHFNGQNTQGFRLNPVIRINKIQEPAFSSAYPCIAGSADPVVFLADDGYPAVLPAVFLQDVPAAVRGAIVYADDLNVCQALIGHTVQTRFQPRCRVVYRNYDRNQR